MNTTEAFNELRRIEHDVSDCLYVDPRRIRQLANILAEALNQHESLAAQPIPFSGAEESPPVFGRRWRIADDGFGVQRDPNGNYVQLDDALSVLHAYIAQPTVKQNLQQQCVDWGVYWQAPDAHGVELTQEQAVDLLRTALGVEVQITSNKAQPVQPAPTNKSLEQQARDLLERMEVPNAQNYSSGELGEVAALIGAAKPVQPKEQT